MSIQSKNINKAFLTPAKEQWVLPEGIEPLSVEHLYYAHRKGYNQGATDQADQDLKELTNLIQNNTTIASDDTIKVIKVMLEVGIVPISAHLKISSRVAIKVLVTVSDEDFLKESFLDIYPKVREIQENSTTDATQ